MGDRGPRLYPPALYLSQARFDGGKTGHDDPLISFYNGIPRPLAEEALRRGGRGESSAVWDTPWPLNHCAALSHPGDLSDVLVSYLDRPVNAGGPGDRAADG